MDLVTLMTLKLTAQHIGTDQFGHRYYEERRARPGKPPRRYVRYSGIAEASKVPADWHGWLHHTETFPPPEGGYDKHEWQQEHQPKQEPSTGEHPPRQKKANEHVEAQAAVAFRAPQHRRGAFTLTGRLAQGQHKVNPDHHGQHHQGRKPIQHALRHMLRPTNVQACGLHGLIEVGPCR